MLFFIPATLMLIFGWIFAVKGLVIASLAICGFSILLLFINLATKLVKDVNWYTYVLYAAVLILSVVKLFILGF